MPAAATPPPPVIFDARHHPKTKHIVGRSFRCQNQPHQSPRSPKNSEKHRGLFYLQERFRPLFTVKLVTVDSSLTGNLVVDTSCLNFALFEFNFVGQFYV
ncbi:hypothetical protein PanWU01x14_066990 [Parasponia andersonii]|uniref:Uncharacterized protein n=1 Tax=Parasponia andersonii TaxID=3476 RepID=A0A2P5DG97_PARAD|nr:hypothetical protein PanWU01x14_066990 [Parasponia andersonii]